MSRGWSIVHYNHDGVALGDVFPSDPEFALYLGKVGYCNYDIDMSSPLAKVANTEPYGTDYKLFYGTHALQGGLHTNVEVSEIEGHTLKVSGNDWLHWFEKQQWPFDPLNPLANVYSQFGRDLFSIVEDWLTAIQAQSNTIQFTYNNGLAGATANAKIDVADTEDMLAKITNLSQGSPGFDFEITPDKVVKLYYPKKGVTSKLVLEQGANVYDFTYTDKGPAGTRTVGTAQGLSSKLGVVLDHVNQSHYRRLMKEETFNDVPDLATLTTLAAGASARNGVPNTEFTCKIIPDFVDDFFSVVNIGDTVVVLADLGWKAFASGYRLVSIVGNPNNEGDQEYQLGFDDGSLSL